MSHFSVLVITNDKPTDVGLTEILQPWHEFECTGIDDQYVKDIDRTEEALAEFSDATVTRLKAPDGELHNQFNKNGEWKPEFSQPDPDVLFGASHRIEFIPAGFEKIEIPASEGKSAAEWISDYFGWPIAGKAPGDGAKYGYIEVDGDGNVVKCIDRTNPDKKWDWWQLGGRWSGHLRVKEGAEAVLGSPGLLGSRASDHRLATDQACVDSIDFETLRNEARAKACDLWDEVHQIVSLHPAFEDWDAIRSRPDTKMDDAREIYWAQPAIAALREAFKMSWGLDDQLEAARMERDAYAQLCADGALNTFAVVKDGQWFERGEMGWWGSVSNEKDNVIWSSEFTKLIDGLPPTAWLSVVDCHI